MKNLFFNKKNRSENKKFDIEMKRRVAATKVFSLIVLLGYISITFYQLDSIYTIENIIETFISSWWIVILCSIVCAWFGLTILWSTKTIKGIILNLFLAVVGNIILTILLLLGYVNSFDNKKFFYF